MKPKRAVDLFLTEASMGCLMAVLPTADATPIVEWTREEISAWFLAGDGYESCPHITAAYGFQPGVSSEEMQEVVGLWGRQTLRFTLGRVERFSDNPKYDVLKVGLDFSSDLSELNAHLASQFGDRLRQTYAYNPHMTLAYVQKGACSSLNGHCKFMGNTYSLRHLVFSLPESVSKSSIALDPADGTSKESPVLSVHAKREVPGPAAS